MEIAPVCDDKKKDTSKKMKVPPPKDPSKKHDASTRVGKICSIIGPVVDVVFEHDVPEIMNALEVPDYPGGRLVLEVRVRTLLKGRECRFFFLLKAGKANFFS